MSECMNTFTSRMLLPEGIRKQLAFEFGFNSKMAIAGCAFIAVCGIGLPLAHVVVPGVGSLWLGLAAFIFAFGPLLLYLKKANKHYFADSVLALFWGIFYYIMLFFAAALAARIGMRFSLKDADLLAFDRFVHLNIPLLVEWSAHHWFGQLANRCYPLLFP